VAMDVDFKKWDLGDEMKIEGNGENLSGGQKQVICFYFSITSH
jgi:ABC-type bacteriocin/lantibiotic exporter with double-glycine peptidase domain